MISLAQFGTFDVENYGDLLFPLILERELSSRLSIREITLYSPVASNLSGIPTQPIPISQMSLFPPSHIVAVIGGGDIISFGDHTAPYYSARWGHPISPSAACWAIPSIYRPSGQPLAWNAPGVPFPFTKEQAPFVKMLASEVDYLSVRDARSQALLQQAGVDSDIAVVPDTICLLPRHLPVEHLQQEAEEIFTSHGFATHEPLLFQMHPVIPKEQIPVVVTLLRKLEKLIQRPILLMPIGYCHGDGEILDAIQRASKGHFALIKQKLSPRQIAAVIAHAGAFLGSSLHGNVTAFAYGVPFLICNYAGLTKLNGFAETIQESDRCLTHLHEALERYHLLQQPTADVKRRRVIDKIDKHFDKLACVISKPSCYVRDPKLANLLEHHLSLFFEAAHWKRCTAAAEQALDRQGIFVSFKRLGSKGFNFIRRFL